MTCVPESEKGLHKSQVQETSNEVDKTHMAQLGAMLT